MDVTVTRVPYSVVLHNREWKISFNGRHYGPYPSRMAAVDAAREAAHRARQIGHDAHVLVQGGDFRFRIDWPGPGETAPAHS